MSAATLFQARRVGHRSLRPLVESEEGDPGLIVSACRQDYWIVAVDDYTESATEVSASEPGSPALLRGAQ